MTDADLAVIVRAIVPVVRETVTKALAEFTPRLAAAETRLEILGDVRDKVIGLETKAALPVMIPDDERQELLGEFRKAVDDKNDDVSVLAAQVAAVDGTAQGLRERLTAVELRLQLKDADAQSTVTTLADLTKDIAAVRERVAIAEVRAPVPGPAGKDGVNGQNGQDGKDGAPGRDGTNGADGLHGKDGAAGRDGLHGKDGAPGKDGADGLGFDDLQVVQVDDRSLTIKAMRGDRVKDIGTMRLPVWIHRGRYLEGNGYEKGDVVTWAGSQWHCNEDTVTKPGDGSRAWTLIVKRGADGKDGRDAQTLPQVKVG